MSKRISPNMVKTLLLKISAILFAVLFLSLPVASYAEEITYTGDGNVLQEAPFWFYTHPALSLFPGTTDAPLSHGNQITINYDSDISEKTNPDNVFGGLSCKLGQAADDNSVVMLNGYIHYDMYGGWSGDGGAADNTIVVKGGSVGENIYGSWGKGMLRNNSVTISDCDIGRSALGAYSIEGDVINNTLTAVDISVAVVGGGWSFDGDAVDNTVALGGDSANRDVFGGNSGRGSATGNKVTLSAGRVGGYVYGGVSDNGNGRAAGNAVAVSGGIVGNAIYGGLNFNGDATGNTVTVSGGIVCSLIYGGAAVSGNATGNTVTINGRPRGLAKADIYGGRSDEESMDSFSGNVLNLNSIGTSAASVSNFEYYNFDLPEDSTGAAMLSIVGAVDLKGTTVKITLQGAPKLEKGDKITLIRSAEGIENAPKNKRCQVKQGGALYEFSIYPDKKELLAVVTKISSAAK